MLQFQRNFMIGTPSELVYSDSFPTVLVVRINLLSCSVKRLVKSSLTTESKICTCQHPESIHQFVDKEQFVGTCQEL